MSSVFIIESQLLFSDYIYRGENWQEKLKKKKLSKFAHGSHALNRTQLINLNSFTFSAQLTANMTREKGEHVEDGADEKMLSGDDKQQLARKDEVKFIASDRSNGDAKIDIGQIEKVCVNCAGKQYAGWRRVLINSSFFFFF